MRTRAYRPEAPAGLEDRFLLSGADPVVITSRQYEGIIQEVHLGFQQYSREGNIPHLRYQLQPVAELIPFGKVDGLGNSINQILTKMRRQAFAGVYRAIPRARNEVINLIHQQVASRIESGDVVLD